LFTLNLETAHAKSILVEGGVENIVLLANKEYLEGTPVIFFSEQLKDRIKEIIDKIDIIIVTGDDPDFFSTDFLDETKTKAIKIIYMFKSKEEIEKKGERLDLKEFNFFQKRPKEEISIYKKEDQKTVLEYKKINPTRYLIKVKTSKSFWLVFSESFHEGWKAYVNDTPNDYGEIVASYFDGEIKEGTHKNVFLGRSTFETWSRELIPEERHLLVNGYANSWYITPEDTGGAGNYELIIEFWPQRLFYIGLGVSLITLLGCLGYLGFSFVTDKLKK